MIQIDQPCTSMITCHYRVNCQWPTQMEVAQTNNPERSSKAINFFVGNVVADCINVSRIARNFRKYVTRPPVRLHEDIARKILTENQQAAHPEDAAYFG